MRAADVRSNPDGTRSSAVLAVGLGTLLLVGIAVQTVVAVARPGLFSPGNDVPNAVVGVIGDGVGEILVGMVLASRLPRNPIGWLLLGFGASTMVLTGAGAIAQAGYGSGHPSLPAKVSLVVSTVANLGILVTVLLVVALFPTGRVAGRARRILPWAGWLLGALLLASLLGSPRLTAGSGSTYPNPLGVSGVGRALSGSGVGPLVVMLCLLAVAVDALRRGFRTRGIERQQMKLFGYAVIGWAIILISGGFIPSNSAWSSVDWTVGSNLIAVAIGGAVLRYRLYDLDQVVSRTVSYAIVTGVLVGVYVGVVSLSTRVLPFSSNVGVAASTLAAAALFNPLRRRIQRSVDGRFNRARYDAETIAAAFAERLRATVDLNRVRPDLLAAVQATIEPQHVSLWLAGERPTPAQP